MTTATQTIHPFELAGLGLAPFHLVGFSEKVFCPCPGAPSKAGGTCDYCGTGIRYCCHIRSADRKEFVVGCDCVRKLIRADNQLIGEVERAEANLRREKKDAARKDRWEAQRAATEAALQAERDRNGGLTNAEMAQAARKAEQDRKAAEMRAINGWLLYVLEGINSYGDFVDAMIEKLYANKLTDLSDRCREILCDIYSKSHGRRGSKAYEAAVERFYDLGGITTNDEE